MTGNLARQDVKRPADKPHTRNKKLLGAPGRTTRSKDATRAPGIATRNKLHRDGPSWTKISANPVHREDDVLLVRGTCYY